MKLNYIKNSLLVIKYNNIFKMEYCNSILKNFTKMDPEILIFKRILKF